MHSVTTIAADRHIQSTASSVRDLLEHSQFSMTANGLEVGHAYPRQSLSERHAGEDPDAREADLIVAEEASDQSYEPPSLVVSIEKDAVAERFTWQGSDYTRGLQVYQVRGTDLVRLLP